MNLHIFRLAAENERLARELAEAKAEIERLVLEREEWFNTAHDLRQRPGGLDTNVLMRNQTLGLRVPRQHRGRL